MSEHWDLGDWQDVDEDDLRRLEQAAELEQQVHAEKTPTELAEDILEAAAPTVAMSLVKIATKDPSSSVRLRASTYLLDRVLGRASDGQTKQAPWESLLDEVTNPVEHKR